MKCTAALLILFKVNGICAGMCINLGGDKTSPQRRQKHRRTVEGGLWITSERNLVDHTGVKRSLVYISSDPGSSLSWVCAYFLFTISFPQSRTNQTTLTMGSSHKTPNLAVIFCLLLWKTSNFIIFGSKQVRYCLKAFSNSSVWKIRQQTKQTNTTPFRRRRCFVRRDIPAQDGLPHETCRCGSLPSRLLQDGFTTKIFRICTNLCFSTSVHRKKFTRNSKGVWQTSSRNGEKTVTVWCSRRASPPESVFVRAVPETNDTVVLFGWRKLRFPPSCMNEGKLICKSILCAVAQLQK